MAQLIPVRNEIASYRIRLELDGTFFRFRIYLNPILECWFLDMFDDADTLLVAGVLIAQSRDLLGQWRYKDGPPGRVVVLDTQNLQRDPDRTNFGERVIMAYVPEAEVAG